MLTYAIYRSEKLERELGALRAELRYVCVFTASLTTSFTARVTTASSVTTASLGDADTRVPPHIKKKKRGGAGTDARTHARGQVRGRTDARTHARRQVRGRCCQARPGIEAAGGGKERIRCGLGACARPGAQFTCFTSTIVQILTPEHLVEAKKESDAALERARAHVLSLLALLVRQYKY